MISYNKTHWICEFSIKEFGISLFSHKNELHDLELEFLLIWANQTLKVLVCLDYI